MKFIRTIIFLALVLGVWSICLPAQTNSNVTDGNTASGLVPEIEAPIPSGPRPRVLLKTRSHGNTWAAVRDQSMEVSKDFRMDCPSVIVTINEQKANYTVLLSHIEVGLFTRDNQVEVYDVDGDLIGSGERNSINRDVRSACTIIATDWATHSAKPSVPTLPQKGASN